MVYLIMVIWYGLSIGLFLYHIDSIEANINGGKVPKDAPMGVIIFAKLIKVLYWIFIMTIIPIIFIVFEFKKRNR